MTPETKPILQDPSNKYLFHAAFEVVSDDDALSHPHGAGVPTHVQNFAVEHGERPDHAPLCRVNPVHCHLYL